MKFLIYGAGVIGSIFAAKLSHTGYDVTVLARKERYRELAAHGIVLQGAYTNQKEIYKVNVIDSLESNDVYDYILVVMQKTQVDAVLPILARNHSPNIVFVVNTPLGYDEWIKNIGQKRLMIGFPSAGGERRGGIVNYFVGKGIARIFQTTTFGEPDGNITPRLKNIVKAFSHARIPAVTTKNMDAW